METKKCSLCNIEKGITGFYKDKYQPTGLKSQCKLCVKQNRNLEQNRKTYHRTKKYYTEYRNRSQDFVKQCKSILGCYFCKNNNPVCLDFHHINPADKKYDLTKVNSINAIRNEMKKCICVCANCHRLIHSNQLSIPENYEIDQTLLVVST